MQELLIEYINHFENAAGISILTIKPFQFIRMPTTLRVLTFGRDAG